MIIESDIPVQDFCMIRNEFGAVLSVYTKNCPVCNSEYVNKIRPLLSFVDDICTRIEYKEFNKKELINIVDRLVFVARSVGIGED